jgi:hypothetical protein
MHAALTCGAVQVLIEGSGRWLVAVWALAEHGLVLVALLLAAVIPDQPEAVEVALARKFWLDERKAHEQRHRERVRLVAHRRSASEARDIVHTSAHETLSRRGPADRGEVECAPR